VLAAQRISNRPTLSFALASGRHPHHSYKAGKVRHAPTGRKAKDLRLFIAIELSEALRTRLTELSEELSQEMPADAIRWVRPEGIHITLKFLGEVAPGKVEIVQRAVSESVPRHPAFSYSANGLGCFPNLKRPRVLWVGIREPTGKLSALQRGIEETFAAYGFEKENRTFHAHLTLGRVRRGTRQADLNHIGDVVGRAGSIALGEFGVQDVCLFRSVLKPSGAVYTCLLAAPLGKGE
jgi:2'-5' RNA ligase